MSARFTSWSWSTWLASRSTSSSNTAAPYRRNSFSIWSNKSAAAVTAAHQTQVIHRDLKPANILLSQVTGSRRPVVKILDFGLGKMFDPDRERAPRPSI